MTCTIVVDPGVQIDSAKLKVANVEVSNLAPIYLTGTSATLAVYALNTDVLVPIAPGKKPEIYVDVGPLSAISLLCSVHGTYSEN